MGFWGEKKSRWMMGGMMKVIILNIKLGNIRGSNQKKEKVEKGRKEEGKKKREGKEEGKRQHTDD
ncbi:hypothetical protein [Streptococcus mutans]|uniref:hypothetical protein n=1 Tax=Streptococcus mutans TaxID=1309 RepID=UPI001455AE5A|nr:hypothetical protein [Streptococcus mutans]NLQ33353.1 hypothetical protein [Streptococcus mutans]